MKFAAAAAAELLQSCPTLCTPIDSSPPGFPIPGSRCAPTWLPSARATAGTHVPESLTRPAQLPTPPGQAGGGPDSGQTQALPPPPPAGDRHSATRSGTVQGHRVLPGQGRAATALPPGDRGSLAFLIWVMKGFQKLC